MEDDSDDPNAGAKIIGPMPERGLRRIRVGKYEFVDVDPETGVDPESGEIPQEWMPPPPMKSLTKKRGPKPKPKPELHPKFAQLKSSVITFDTPGDPEGKTWGAREPYKAYQWAREQYLEGNHRLDELSSFTGFDRRRIDQWAYQSSKERMSWSEECKAAQNAAVRAIAKNMKDKCVELIDETLTIVTHKIRSIKEEDAKKLTVKEVQLLVGVAQDLHKISQLEEGKPTDITGKVNLTRQSVLERLKQVDPMVDYEAATNDTPETETTH